MPDSVNSTPSTETAEKSSDDILASMENSGDLIIIDDVPMTVTIDSVPDMVVSNTETVVDESFALVTHTPPEPSLESLFVVDTESQNNSVLSHPSEVISPEVTIARAIDELTASGAYNQSLIQASLDRATSLKAEKENAELAHASEIQRL